MMPEITLVMPPDVALHYKMLPNVPKQVFTLQSSIGVAVVNHSFKLNVNIPTLLWKLSHKFKQGMAYTS